MYCAASGGRIHNMHWRRIIVAVVVAALAVFVLYDVQFVFDVAGAGEARRPDPAVETAYANCYATMDDEIHATAFGTIDNPDVQKEYITANRARAAAECRARHPESIITVAEPGRFNLVDLAPRFW